MQFLNFINVFPVKWMVGLYGSQLVRWRQNEHFPRNENNLFNGLLGSAIIIPINRTTRLTMYTLII